MGVDEKHAIAMPFDGAVHDVILEVGDSCHRCGDFDPVVQGREHPTISAAAGTSCRAYSYLVHFRAGLQIIQGANAVPRLHSGGRVAARVPPPHAFAMGTVMK